MGRIFDRLHQKRVLRRWRRAVRLAETAPLADLRAQRNDARQLRCQINKLLHVADGRLALPRIGSTSFPRPQGTDWAWRPELWRGPLPVPGISSAPTRSRLGNEITLFHDCPRAEMTLRQLRNTREADLAPFGLGMDVFSFGGTFLSLVIDLPSEAVEGLRSLGQQLMREYSSFAELDGWNPRFEIHFVEEGQEPLAADGHPLRTSRAYERAHTPWADTAGLPVTYRLRACIG